MQFSVWNVPADLLYVQPVLTEEAAAQAEALLGVTLPRAYLDLLREQNGGYLRPSALPASSVWYPDAIWGIGPNFPNITAVWAWSDWNEDAPKNAGPLVPGRSAFSETEGEWKPENAELLIPFDGDGFWFLCFDYRLHGPYSEPCISYIDLGERTDRKIAGCFSDFLEMLKPVLSQNALGIRTPGKIEDVAARLDEVFGSRHVGPWISEGGYPVCKWGFAWPGFLPSIQRLFGRLEVNDVWPFAFLSPNEVPRGYVSDDNPRYAELVDLLPGTALRFPEYPDCRFILECDLEITTRVKAALSKAGLDFVSVLEENRLRGVK